MLNIMAMYPEILGSNISLLLYLLNDLQTFANGFHR